MSKKNEKTNTPAAQVDGDDGLIRLIESAEGDLETAPGHIPLPAKLPVPLDSSYVENRLREQYSHWESGVGEAHERLYRFLGQIYEWAPVIKSQVGLEAKIIALINERHGKKIRSVETGEEALLMLAVGFGDVANVKRCNWRRALKAAEEHEQRRNASEVADWLREKGGIKAAVALAKQSPTTSTFEAIPYLESLINEATERTAAGNVALRGGVQLLFVKGNDDGTMDVLGPVNDLEVFQLAAKRLKAGKDKIDKVLWDLNRFALRAAENNLAGKMTARDAQAFAEGIQFLLSDPATAKHYFNEDAIPLEVPKKSLAKDRFPVVNPSFNLNDPGRYVHGAKQGALLPYEADEDAWGKLTWLQRLESKSRNYINLRAKAKVADDTDPSFRKQLEAERASVVAERDRVAEREARPQLEETE